MKLSTLISLAGLAITTTAATGAAPLAARDYEANDYYVLHLDPETSPDQVALHLGLVHEGSFGTLPGHHIFSGNLSEDDVVTRELQQRRRRKRDLGAGPDGSNALDGVLFTQKQVLRKPWEKRIIPPAPAAEMRRRQALENDAKAWAVKKQDQIVNDLGIHDPVFRKQWHLFNTVQTGHDLNVTGLWMEGVTGKNTTVAIVDDGLDMYSDDLKDNFYAKGSYDFNEKTEEPKPRLADDKHGTRCAGEVSAVRNNVCGVGIAYDSKIAGLRILSKAITDADEALALNYDYDNNLIYSCSWGPPDDGRSMDAPGILIRRAMLNAVQNGRSGLGSIYVFASGNGAASEDNCNFDGYTNSIYSITVGAVDRNGDHPYYSEKCSASLVVAYSSGGGDAIYTTDVGQNACYNAHGGTSAAAPLAAGIFALALQVRPDLTWRDMQYIAMDTAVPLHLDDGEWQDTYIGKKYSHTYAYGKIDSYALVETARTWKNVKPQAWYFSPWIHVREAIPQGDKGLAVTVDITEAMLKEANLGRVEHVTVTMNIEHTRRGDLSVDLISPNKVVSHLSATRRPDNIAAGYVDWTFMSVVHWGESGVGEWTVVVKDSIVNEHNGTFTDFHLKLWGESDDASKAKPLPMPSETDDDDHALTATTTLQASTTTLPPGATSTNGKDPVSTATKPTDHPDRPTKPTDAGASMTDAAKPSSTGAVNGTETEHESEPAASTSASSNHSWMPSFLSNLSTKTQIWIYGAVGLIVTFCIGLGVYLYLARRRRLRNGDNNYEFELIDDEEAEALNSGNVHEKGRSGGRRGAGRRKATRGGELYDAFAEGSDEEYDLDDEDYEEEGESSSQGGLRSRSRSDSDDAGSDDGHQPQQQQQQQGVADSDDEPQHHVIGDDSDSDDSDSGARAPGSGQDSARLL